MRHAYMALTCLGARVSTLIRPEGRMRPVEEVCGITLTNVSTLIRPEGRMRRLPFHKLFITLGFQPSSDPKAGCDELVRSMDTLSDEFQPSSDPKAGCDAR